MKEMHRAGVHTTKTPTPGAFSLFVETLIGWSGLTLMLQRLSPTLDQVCCDYETALVKGFGEAMIDDQAEGLPLNTKIY
ncbi:hypothetical protein BGW36DRAFT_426281 [Talaromyces proteolyticus]|uniref:Uncharacterized protein n=1 Tax=Talaromyces proteolyticus TaxID=1131652 RepID=A0AAD4Q1K6_9EURO|nr:uncharacterized protein BGW36DRAFT_426281 [Talaromyces proteolyticus]KAH8698580.1 hypothetical protein BGW36DRAFT_426281 [Talaromyces proteolyticus]